jgi:hypothetical protein
VFIYYAYILTYVLNTTYYMCSIIFSTLVLNKIYCYQIFLESFSNPYKIFPLFYFSTIWLTLWHMLFSCLLHWLIYDFYSYDYQGTSYGVNTMEGATTYFCFSEYHCMGFWCLPLVYLEQTLHFICWMCKCAINLPSPTLWFSQSPLQKVFIQILCKAVLFIVHDSSKNTFDFRQESWRLGQ